MVTVAVTSSVPLLTARRRYFARVGWQPRQLRPYIGTGNCTEPSAILTTSPSDTPPAAASALSLGARVGHRLLERIVHGLAIVAQSPIRSGNLTSRRSRRSQPEPWRRSGHPSA